MEWYWILLIVLGSVLVFALLSGLILTFLTAYIIFTKQLVRTSKEKWNRSCSAPENAEQMEMWNASLAWAEKEKKYKEDVHIINDGLNLYGEFYNYGSNKTVIILPGRCESLGYSYYYAEPYHQLGINVLVVDARAHGWSDGKYNTAGIFESSDVLAWLSFLHKEKKQDSIYAHCICIGGAAALIAAVSNQAPSYFKGIVFDGLFYSFKEVFANHQVALGHGLFPVFYQIWFWFRLKTGVSINKSFPYLYLPKLKIPAVFFYGKKDIYSLPERSQLLYDSCGSQDKSIVWFPNGAHSHIRLNNLKEYDQAIVDFFKKY